MQRWGFHPSGIRRWRCKICKKNIVWKRKDNRERKRLSLFIQWLTSKVTLNDIARREKMETKTLYRWFANFWADPPKPAFVLPVRVLVLDATTVVNRKCVLLIAGNNDKLQPVSWFPAVRESGESWHQFLSKLLSELIRPLVVVCDGQRGLLKAVHEVWPNAKIQRCLVHIIRQSCNWITQHPKTKAGKELLILVYRLSLLRTKRQKRRWIRAFKYWCRKHHNFLKERTQSPHKRWWYVHKKLRATRSLLHNAIPDLFRYITDVSIPKTSNHVEGGMNARIQELFRCHRGFSVTKKLALASWYLALRQGQKPTRNVH